MRISDWSSDVCSSDLPPARGGRAGVAVAVGRAVAVDLEAQQTLMTDIGMICQERVTKADLAGPVAFGRTNLDRKAEHSRWQTPRLGQVEAAWHVQRGVYVENGEIGGKASRRSEEHTSELQSLMRISYAVFCLKK